MASQRALLFHSVRTRYKSVPDRLLLRYLRGRCLELVMTVNILLDPGVERNYNHCSVYAESIPRLPGIDGNND